MKLEIHTLYTVIFCFTLLAVLGYVKKTREVIELDGHLYAYVGMAQLPTPDGIYTPVYKRLK